MALYNSTGLSINTSLLTWDLARRKGQSLDKARPVKTRSQGKTLGRLTPVSTATMSSSRTTAIRNTKGSKNETVTHVFKWVHFRRHINPVTVDIEDADKKMLVMKDLNVQYFPCKICGAKFPSYYFVHKHKKMWHAAQMEQEDLNMDQDADKC